MYFRVCLSIVAMPLISLLFNMFLAERDEDKHDEEVSLLRHSAIDLSKVHGIESLVQIQQHMQADGGTVVAKAEIQQHMQAEDVHLDAKAKDTVKKTAEEELAAERRVEQAKVTVKKTAEKELAERGVEQAKDTVKKTAEEELAAERRVEQAKDTVKKIVSKVSSDNYTVRSSITHSLGKPTESQEDSASEAETDPEKDRVNVRPNYGKGPEVIRFGILCKNFHSINFATETAASDLVITLEWDDHRVSELVPKYDETLTVSTEHAKSIMWLPDIVVTNRVLKGYEVISSSLTLSKTGTVMKTERVLAVLKLSLDVRAFPFDSQVLHVHIGSATFMREQMLLSEIKQANVSGVLDGVFNHSGFVLDSVKTGTHSETDGTLKKSWGSLNIHVTRDSWPIVVTVLAPEFMLLTISWAVFFFPMLPQFVTPRVSTSLVSLLALITFATRTSQLLPPNVYDVWIAYFEELCRTMMFFTVCTNLFVEVIYHQLKLTELATSMNDELKWMFGALQVVAFTLCLWSYKGHLKRQALITRVVLYASFAWYIIYSFYRVHRSKQALGDKEDS